MTQKKKTVVKSKTGKVVTQPKKATPVQAASRGVTSNTRPVASASRKPVAAAKSAAVAPASPARPSVLNKKTVPTPKVATKSAPVAVKPAASVKPVAASKPATGKAAVSPAKTSAVAVSVKKPAVAAQPRSEAVKAAQAFAAHRAHAAQVSVPAAPPARAVPASVAKPPASSKLTAPAQSPAAAAPASPKAIAEKTAAARVDANKKPVNSRHGFKTNEFVVYPAHGVGRIVGIEEQEIAGMALELFVISFEKEKLTLRVPTGKLQSVGMRKLADDDIVKRAMEILKGRARIKRTMWSRRAQEYVAKINSGDLISIAEVVRDLYRSEAQPEQSYSERQLYEDALDRMAREIAAVEKLDDRGAVQRITEVLSKSAKGRRVAEEGEPEEVQAA